jgi:hypothetical protein
VVERTESDETTLLLYCFEGRGTEVTDAGPLGLHGRVVSSEEARPGAQPSRVEGVAGGGLARFARACAETDLNPFARPERFPDVVVWGYEAEGDAFRETYRGNFEADWRTVVRCSDTAVPFRRGSPGVRTGQRNGLISRPWGSTPP